MMRKTLIPFLIVFLGLSGLSWGIERVEKKEKIRRISFSGGWTSGVSASDFLNESGLFNRFCQKNNPKDLNNGLSLGLGYSQNFSSRLLWQVNFKYYYYKGNDRLLFDYSEQPDELRDSTTKDIGIRSYILELNLSLKHYLFPVKHEVSFNPYVGFGASLVHSIFKCSIKTTYYPAPPSGIILRKGEQLRFKPGITGCFGLDFILSENSTIFFDTNLLITSKEHNDLLKTNNVIVSLGFARYF